MQHQSDTANLAQRWIEQKEMEDLSRENRVSIEEELINQLDHSNRDEGSHTFNLEGYKITITKKITRKMDNTKSWLDFADADVPEHLNPITLVEKPVIDSKVCRELRDSHPAIYSKLAESMSSKQAKTAVKIERK